MSFFDPIMEMLDNASKISEMILTCRWREDQDLAEEVLGSGRVGGGGKNQHPLIYLQSEPSYHSYSSLNSYHLFSYSM